MKNIILILGLFIGFFAITSIDFDVGVDNQTKIVQTMSFDAVINNVAIDTKFVHLEVVRNYGSDQGMKHQPGIQYAKYEHAQKNLSLFYTKECDNSKRINGTSGGQPYDQT